MNGPQAGDFLSCTGKRTLSKIIKKVTKSEITHSAYAIDVWGELYIIDSQKDGTNPRKYDDWCKTYDYKVIVHRPLNKSKEQIKEEHKKAMSKSGKTPYDKVSLIIFQPIYNFFGVWLGKKGAKAIKKSYCSEFTAWLEGIPDFFLYSPAMFYEYMLNNNQYETFEL